MAMHTFVSHLLFNLAPPEKGFHGMKRSHESPFTKTKELFYKTGAVVAIGSFALTGCGTGNAKAGGSETVKSTVTASAEATSSSGARETTGANSPSANVSQTPEAPKGATNTPTKSSSSEKNSPTPSPEATPEQIEIVGDYKQFATQDFVERRKDRELGSADVVALFFEQNGGRMFIEGTLDAGFQTDPMKTSKEVVEAWVANMHVVQRLLNSDDPEKKQAGKNLIPFVLETDDGLPGIIPDGQEPASRKYQKLIESGDFFNYDVEIHKTTGRRELVADPVGHIFAADLTLINKKDPTHKIHYEVATYSLRSGSFKYVPPRFIHVHTPRNKKEPMADLRGPVKPTWIE